MNREIIIQLLTNPIHPQTQIQVIFEYIFERKGERIQGNVNISPFDLMLINQMYESAIEWYSKKFNINYLYKGDQLIKIF